MLKPSLEIHLNILQHSGAVFNAIIQKPHLSKTTALPLFLFWNIIQDFNIYKQSNKAPCDKRFVTPPLGVALRIIKKSSQSVSETLSGDDLFPLFYYFFKLPVPCFCEI